MKCPECGNEVPEGFVYCGYCGREFKLVPEFEPEIEAEIDSTLATLANKIGSSKDFDSEKNAERSLRSERTVGKSLNKNRYRSKKDGFSNKRIILFTAVIFVLISVIILLRVAFRQKDVSYYVNMANSAYLSGDNAAAIEKLENAEKKFPENGEIILLLASYKLEAEDTEGAIQELYKIINSAAYTEDESRQAFSMMAAIYYERGAMDLLKSLLERSPFEDIKESYAGNIPAMPVIQPAGGEYEGGVEVTIAAPGNGEIFYTTDGSVPTKNSSKYRGKIKISEPEKYIIKALFVSENGYESDIASCEYVINAKPLEEPKIAQASGTYNKKTKIVCVADEELVIRYSVGKDMTVNEMSTVYTGPIEMPEGESYFNFACFDNKGNMSEIVRRNYILTIERHVSAEAAIESVKATLKEKSYLQSTMSFAVEDIIVIGNDGEFYFIKEYNNGTATGLLYAVNTDSGLTRRLGYDSQGKYILMAID